MSVEIEKTTVVTISVNDVIEKLDLNDIGDFCNGVAGKFDTEFKKRNWMAARFAENLSEDGCRWLAEVVTQHYMRQTKDGL